MELTLGTLADVEITEELFSGLIEDNKDINFFISELEGRSLLIFKEKGVFCGLGTMDLSGDEDLETHLIIHPSKRHLSTKAIKTVVDLAKKAGKTTITSVSGDYPHIKRYLEIVGFETSSIVRDDVLKNGIYYDRYFMFYSK